MNCRVVENHLAKSGIVLHPRSAAHVLEPALCARWLHSLLLQAFMADKCVQRASAQGEGAPIIRGRGALSQ